MELWPRVRIRRQDKGERGFLFSSVTISSCFEVEPAVQTPWLVNINQRSKPEFDYDARYQPDRLVRPPQM